MRRRNLKAQQFNPTVSPTVHTNSSRKQSFRKRSSNRENLKMSVFNFRVDGEQFDFNALVSSDTNPKWPVIVAQCWRSLRCSCLSSAKLTYLNFLANLNVEKIPTIMSDTARLTRRKFMGVLMVLSFSTTRQTSELPIKLIATMTEHREIITLDTMMIHSCIVGVCCPIGKKNRLELYIGQRGKF